MRCLFLINGIECLPSNLTSIKLANGRMMLTLRPVLLWRVPQTSLYFCVRALSKVAARTPLQP